MVLALYTINVTLKHNFLTCSITISLINILYKLVQDNRTAFYTLYLFDKVISFVNLFMFDLFNNQGS